MLEIPGDRGLAVAASIRTLVVKAPRPVIVAHPGELARAADLLNEAKKVTILARTIGRTTSAGDAFLPDVSSPAVWSAGLFDHERAALADRFLIPRERGQFHPASHRRPVRGGGPEGHQAIRRPRPGPNTWA
ncbi:hypothetical protein GCM10023166_19320 [Paeniglutamicibacter cryotolerans]